MGENGVIDYITAPPVKLMQHSKAKHFIMEDINSPARRIYID